MSEKLNAVRCKMCNEVLISRSRHDFRRCGCPNRTFVDGGDDYMRYGGTDLEYVEVLDGHVED